MDSTHNLDQHFLDDEGAKHLVQLAEITPDDVVVDVGAGKGALLKHVPPCRKLVAIELDSALAAGLREAFPSVTVEEGNALQLLPAIGADKIISNVPFTIAEPLAYLLFRLEFSRAVLLVPSNFAELLAAQTGIIGLYSSAFLHVHLVEPFDPAHLSPAPDTTLSITVLSRKTPESAQELLLFELFTQRDKKTGNALREALCRTNGWTKRQSEEAIDCVPADVRAKIVPRLTEAELKLIVAELVPKIKQAEINTP